MSDLNTATLSGRVVAKPKVYQTDDYNITRFSIATTEHYKAGEQINKPLAQPQTWRGNSGWLWGCFSAFLSHLAWPDSSERRHIMEGIFALAHRRPLSCQT